MSRKGIYDKTLKMLSSNSKYIKYRDPGSATVENCIEVDREQICGEKRSASSCVLGGVAP